MIFLLKIQMEGERNCGPVSSMKKARSLWLGRTWTFGAVTVTCVTNPRLGLKSFGCGVPWLLLPVHMSVLHIL